MRGRRLRSDVANNLAFALVKAAALVWLIRVAAGVFSPVELGIFLLARRLSSTGANLVQCGASQTLLRYVALNADNPVTKRNYAVFALVSWLMISAAGGTLCFLFRWVLARWSFPGHADGMLAFWVGILLLATVLDFLVRSYLVAERRLTSANLLELMNGSGFLLVVLLFSREQTVTSVLRFQVWTMAGLSLAVVGAWLLRMPSGAWPDRADLARISQTYAVYGLPRGLITFLDMGLLLIGPWLLRGSPAQAGFLLIALSVTQIFAAAIAPIAQVATVVAARFVGRNDESALKEGVALLCGAALHTALPLLAVMWPWSRQIVLLWLKEVPITDGVVPHLSILLWGIVPFVLFQSLKGIVEARWVQPFNLYSLIVGIGTLLLAYGFLPADRMGAVTAAVALAVSFWVIGALTIVWLRAYLPSSEYLGWPRLAALVVVLAVTNTVLAHLGGLGAFVTAAAVSVSAYGVFVWLSPTPFVKACQAFVWPSPQPL